MEIEAKFCVPDEKTFQSLKTIDQLAGFTLSEGHVKQVRDIYLDTTRHAILAAGYVCRRREQSNGVLITLKAIGGAEGSIHRREELEILLPTYRPPAQWPASPTRERVLGLIGDSPLVLLFELQQTRLIRPMSQSGRSVAELSLDEVHIDARDKTHIYLVLEAELAPQGTEDDLAAVVNCLQNEWGLEPEPLSKFERAAALLGYSAA